MLSVSLNKTIPSLEQPTHCPEQAAEIAEVRVQDSVHECEMDISEFADVIAKSFK